MILLALLIGAAFGVAVVAYWGILTLAVLGLFAFLAICIAELIDAAAIERDRRIARERWDWWERYG